MEHKFSWNYLPHSTHTYLLLTTFHTHKLPSYHIPRTHTHYLPHSTHTYFLFTTFQTHTVKFRWNYLPHSKHTYSDSLLTTFHTHILFLRKFNSVQFFCYGDLPSLGRISLHMVGTMCKPTDLAGWSLIP